LAVIKVGQTTQISLKECNFKGGQFDGSSESSPRSTTGPAITRHTTDTKGERRLYAGSLPYFLYGAIALFILGVIAWGTAGPKGFLESLSDRTVARGLITFLITITTMGIAIILAISTIISDGSAADQRFDKGKQVLSVLIGLMGTIVGFYFGASTDTKTQTQALAIAPATISNQQAKKGDKFTISFVASGGRPPYVYSIIFDSATPLASIKDAKSADGAIKQEFTVPDTLAADTEVKFQTSVTDSDNKTVDYRDGT
jgi:hypothetical protein